MRAGDDPREAQLRLIRDGEATNPTAIKEQAVSFDEEFANEEELNGEEE